MVTNRTHLAAGRAADSKEDGLYEIDTAAAVVPGYATLIRSAGSSITDSLTVPDGPRKTLTGYAD